MKRRLWFEVHSWLGVITGLMLFFICWSGTVAVFSHEIDWLLDARMHAPPAQSPSVSQPPSPQVNWQTLEASVTAAYPDAERFSLHAPLYPGFAAHAVVDTPRQTMMRVYLDPATGKVLGESSYFNVQRFFRSLHMSLFDLGSGRLWGYILVCSFSISLLISAVAPLLFYSRWWRGLYTVKTNRGPRVFWSDLHKFTGMWGLLFTFLMAITGLWYLAELFGVDFAYPEPPFFESVTAPGARIALTDALRITQDTWPALQVTSITPENGSYWGNVIRLEGQAEAALVRDRANFIMLDPATGTVAALQNAAALPWPARWVDTADPLHFGDFAGFWVKLVWFTFGLLLTGLCLTGAYLHVQRLKNYGTSKRYRWRGTLAALVVTAAALLIAGWGGRKELLSYGPSIDGAASMPDVPAAVTVFLFGWSALTLAIMAAWSWYVLKSPHNPEAPRTLTPSVASWQQ